MNPPNPRAKRREDVRLAFLHYDVEKLDELASQGSFPHEFDGWSGSDWLGMAVAVGNLASVRWMLAKGIDANLADYGGQSSLVHALGSESEKVRRERADPGKAAEETIAMIDVLIAAGADVNGRGILGHTPLHCAVGRSSPRVLRHLLDRGADPNLAHWDYEPETPADLAAFLERWEAHAVLSEAMGHGSAERRTLPSGDGRFPEG